MWKCFETKLGVGVWASGAGGRSGIKPLKWCHPLIEEEEKFWIFVQRKRKKRIMLTLQNEAQKVPA